MNTQDTVIDTISLYIPYNRVFKKRFINKLIKISYHRREELHLKPLGKIVYSLVGDSGERFAGIELYTDRNLCFLRISSKALGVECLKGLNFNRTRLVLGRLASFLDLDENTFVEDVFRFSEVTRLDIKKDIEVRLFAMEDFFNFIACGRFAYSKRETSYPTTYYWSNKRVEFKVYDKIEELKKIKNILSEKIEKKLKEKELGLVRSELRLKRRSVILENIKQTQKSNISDWGKKSSSLELIFKDNTIQSTYDKYLRKLSLPIEFSSESKNETLFKNSNGRVKNFKSVVQEAGIYYLMTHYFYSWDSFGQAIKMNYPKKFSENYKWSKEAYASFLNANGQGALLREIGKSLKPPP